MERALGRRPAAVGALGGGCVADVREVRFADGSRCVAKLARSGGLEVEAWMLGFLAAHTRLPVPEVLHHEDSILLLSYVENDGGEIDASVQEHAADLLADLHELTAPCFGLERDTVIGGLLQPNLPDTSWLEFFRTRRLVFMGRRALAAGAINAATFDQLERLCERLGEWIEEPPKPSLVHGDMWAGNILVQKGRVAAFVDPAIHFADAEVELAFSTLFSTFGDAFFGRYRERRTLRPGFFEVRRDLYNLYPLLVHAVLFGASYGAAVDRTLRRFLGK